MTYRIDLEKFGNERSFVERLKPREIGNSKFNIKVRKSDLRLIDRLAELAGKSRAFVLNTLVQDILIEMLHDRREEDEDSAALLALYVDQKLGKSEVSTDGWSAALFGLESYIAKSYWLRHDDDDYQPSEEYWEITRRIQALKK
jgi:hypothetical protein